MKAIISPSKAFGTVKIPPSKSMSHRAIICAALAKGVSKISNIAFSEDIITTIDGLRVLGAKIDCFSDYVIVDGTNTFSEFSSEDVNCNESGSTLRFFVPIFSLLDKKITFLGKNRLLLRPQEIYRQIFTERNLYFFQTDKLLTIDGKLPAGEYHLNGDVSSQFISGLLFALPLLNQDSTIHIKPPYESRSYVDLTLQMLKDFGINVTYLDENTLFIKGNQQYLANDHTVEGDFSQFGFFATLGAINADITCTGLNTSSLQGDRQMVDILKNAGVKIHEFADGYTIYKSDINPTDINLENCPDLGPILTVFCANANGRSRIFNAARLRIKESDRTAAMETELSKFSVDISSNDSEIFINGISSFDTNSELFSHKDHRIVMSLAILGTICQKPVVIEDAEYIKKSYPHFFEDLKNLGINVVIENG